jgi:Fe2+ or Zn2+ uptake regulation protein
MKQDYYNTNKLSGDDLKQANAQAKFQQDLILDIFKERGEAMTPFEVQACLEAKNKAYPITSIRRAISNLTDAGELVKLDLMRPGVYKKPNHCWQRPQAA